MGCGSSAVPKSARAENICFASSPSAAKTLLGSPVSPKLSGGWEAKQCLFSAECQIDGVDFVGSDVIDYRYGAAPQAAHDEIIGVESRTPAPNTLLESLVVPEFSGGREAKQSWGQSWGSDAHHMDEVSSSGAISLRQTASSTVQECYQKQYETRIQAHHQIYLTAMENRELALQNRELELQNEELLSVLSSKTESVPCETENFEKACMSTPRTCAVSVEALVPSTPEECLEEVKSSCSGESSNRRAEASVFFIPWHAVRSPSKVNVYAPRLQARHQHYLTSLDNALCCSKGSRVDAAGSPSPSNTQRGLGNVHSARLEARHYLHLTYLSIATRDSALAVESFAALTTGQGAEVPCEATEVARIQESQHVYLRGYLKDRDEALSEASPHREHLDNVRSPAHAATDAAAAGSPTATCLAMAAAGSAMVVVEGQ